MLTKISEAEIQKALAALALAKHRGFAASEMCFEVTSYDGMWGTVKFSDIWAKVGDGNHHDWGRQGVEERCRFDGKRLVNLEDEEVS